MVTIQNEHNTTDLDRRSVLGLASGAAIVAAGSSNVRAAATSVAASDIVMMDAIALRSAIHSRQLSCSEVMNAYLDHIEKLNPKVSDIQLCGSKSAMLRAWFSIIGRGSLRSSRAKAVAAAETGLSLRRFPVKCPFTVTEIVDPDFLPE